MKKLLLALTLSILSILAPKGASASGAFPVYNLYSTTSVTSVAYVQLVASTAKGSTGLCVSNTGANDVYIAVGAAGSEVKQLLAPLTTLSTQVCYPINLPYGSRISAESVGATTNTTGELDLNLIYY